MRQINNRRYTRTWQKKKRRRKTSFDFGFVKKMLNRRTGILLFVLLAVASLVYIFLFANYFTIKNIKLSGTQSISSDKVTQIINDELANKVYGSVAGNNYFLVNPDQLDKKLRAAFPEIDSISIHKIFPGEMDIVIKEKNPALIWCRSNCYFVNDQGSAYLPASEQDLSSQNQHFVRITEEALIVEEKDAATPPAADAAENKSATDETDATAAEKSFDINDNTSAVLSDSTTSLVPEISVSTTISANEQVSDNVFIKFALDINNSIGYNQKLKIKYYKTKGIKTRELIAFTDKNIRIYFDATQDAKKQTDNLNYFLEKGIESGKIDSLQYIYLKNNDRVFYK